MNLTIIGAGVVGKATGNGFARFGHHVTFRDKGDDPVVPESDLTFICTPEDAVPSVMEALMHHSKFTGGIVVRSTVPPWTCYNLSMKYHVGILHNPEHLREAIAEQDFLNTDFAIVGEGSWEYRSKYLDDLVKLYTDMGCYVETCWAVESELAKLVVNSYLATQISFWNEISSIAIGLGVNSHRLARIVLNDERVSKYGANMHGQPYGGKCLPKDIAQLANVASKAGKADLLLEAVRQINENLGGMA